MVAEGMNTGFTSAATLDAIYGPGAAQRVRQANVLVVGAGGVGCELVKNLASSGFGSITLIDLDTIDVSNLNRQFLFRKHHVGKSKAEKAAESIIQMVPGTKVDGKVGNVKEARFGVSFFKTFHLVCNALDNLEARRHVNRMCLAAGVPLVESGSTGYVGQCAVIGKGFECYDCTGRPPQKSYAVCTIRSTPDKPVHCVVWAKFLYELLFGPEDDGNVLKDLDGVAPAQSNGTQDTNSAANSQNIANGDQEMDIVPSDNGHEKQAPSEGKDTRTVANGEGNGEGNATGEEMNDIAQGEKDEDKRLGNDKKDAAVVANGGEKAVVDERRGVAQAENGAKQSAVAEEEGSPKPKPKRVRYVDGEDVQAFAARVCDRVFVDDIQQQIKMKDLWKERAAPIVYNVSAVADGSPVDVSKLNLLDQDVWTAEQSASIFKATLVDIVEKRRSEIGSLSFDKDDREALMFVAAASNLRSNSFGVSLQSPFAVKGIAGNIVHAVATTNAIVGGLIVLEALKIIVNDGSVDKCVTTFVNRAVSGNRVKKILIPEGLKAANKNCFVCSKGQLHLSLDVEKTSLQSFVTSVLKGKLSIMEPGVHVKTGEYHNTVYECGSGLEEDEIETYNENLGKTLRELRVEDGSELVVEDFAQNLRTTLHVTDVKGFFSEKNEDERFSLDGEVAKAKASKTCGGEESKDEEEAEDVDDDSLLEVEVTSRDVIEREEEQVVEDMRVDSENLGSKKRLLEDSVNVSSVDDRQTKRARGAE